MRQIHLLGRSAIAALLVLGCSGAVRAQTPTWLQQGWTPADRNMFYTTSQGSQMMPYDWFMALERPDSETPFRADSLARFGYLPNREGHKLGGYQVWTGYHSYAEPGTGERIVDEIVTMLQELRNTSDPK